mmetsp:Transcript_10244/g.15423  ORF Transcript_10244/g.15423 Transcript_10244/m.15423 type:complete len:434 (-) Transcript_10244:35-1336(-)
MARKKIREYHGKKLLAKHFATLTKLPVEKHPQIECALVDADSDYKKIKSEEEGWIGGSLVAKPDMMFGQRGKHDLVILNKPIDEIQVFLDERMGKEITVNGQTAALTHFLVEPFVPHKREYYVSITIEREYTQFLFSPFGGIGVEENWEKMVEIHVQIGEVIDNVSLEKFEESMKKENIDKEEIDTVLEFLKTLYRLYEYLDFTTLEINPFVVNDKGQPTPLDLVAEVDSTAFFKNQAKWGTLPFPLPFGRTMSEEEDFIQKLDEKTGASLKLTILNPTGRIWNMVAGGGASVIFADTVCDVGYSHELANYGEYSGGPSEEETYLYAKTLISLATRNPDPEKPRALLIGGGIANFTDVAITFKGIIHALVEAKDNLKACGMKIWVRRGGVNAQAGLDQMRQLGVQLGLPVTVYGPETHMTFIVREAVQSIFEK